MILLLFFFFFAEIKMIGLQFNLERINEALQLSVDFGAFPVLRVLKWVVIERKCNPCQAPQRDIMACELLQFP